MGKTRRRRRRKKTLERLDHLQEVIDLRQWLSKNGWTNETRLDLANFPATGRGVTSSINLRKNDVIVSIPLDLMITYPTLGASLRGILSPSNGMLEMHDLLAIFLVTEKNKERSLWREYINSLPQEAPPLPWLGTAAELDFYPADLRIIAGKKRENLEESMYRARRSIEKHSDCVLDENLFKWGYVLVNTRAVYVQPDFVRNMINNPLDDVLADDPKMALCPFLDMFNHHFLAATEAEMVSKKGRFFFELKTLSGTDKYNEIFISYGLHDNIKLIMEYGFYIQNNILDTVKFELQEVLSVLKLNLDERQYKFLKDHNFDKSDDLYIGYEGVSFALRAVLFVSFNETVRNYNSVVFGSYPEDFFEKLPVWTDKLLMYKSEMFQKDYRRMAEYKFNKSRHAVLMEDFLRYRMGLPICLIETLSSLPHIAT